MYRKLIIGLIVAAVAFLGGGILLTFLVYQASVNQQQKEAELRQVLRANLQQIQHAMEGYAQENAGTNPFPPDPSKFVPLATMASPPATTTSAPASPAKNAPTAAP